MTEPLVLQRGLALALAVGLVLILVSALKGAKDSCMVLLVSAGYFASCVSMSIVR
ncbi:hypothetical protein [Paeniglutamicibacter cryotolerans]|uniref:Uncharacterized protein n=1 Tax=Paeniglutamicibacter cryotolerans TaxID=670079 RepID=A0A839QMJ5_9MICC|nr:hypothetical protein [Paeniglutamicibacter cryotolerans]MBB2996990.1 hypothetical protein [Paeniglutamicibacter cryotolerans]